MCKVTQFDTIPVKIGPLVIAVAEVGGGTRIQSDMSNGDWLEHITWFANWLLGTVHVMLGCWLVMGWGGEIDIHMISAWSGHVNLIPYCEEVVNRELGSFCQFNVEYTLVVILPPHS